MALVGPFNFKGVVFNQSYHRVAFRSRDKKLKQSEILIKIYANAAAAEADAINNILDMASIMPIAEDFTEFFENVLPGEGNILPEKFAYDFLKTIDPEEEGSKYPNILFDYKNDFTSDI